MRKLYHHELSPTSRKIRVSLAEKRLDFEALSQETWVRGEAFLALNPAGEVPVLIEPGGFVVADVGAISEYLDEVYPNPVFSGPDPHTRAEVRRLCAWFDVKFNREVTEPIVQEKLMRRMLSLGSPDSTRLRNGQGALREHLTYIAWLIYRRRWLAGDSLSYADLSAAAHLSLIDYAGDVPWADFPDAKEWYALVKSRPSFRQLLEVWIPNVRPPVHYADPDF